MRVGRWFCILRWLELKVGFLGIRWTMSLIIWWLVVVNTVTNRVVRLLGKDETGRWLNLALYQGAPAKKGITTMVRCVPERMINDTEAVWSRQWQHPPILSLL